MPTTKQLSTIQGILSATRQNEKLRYDPNLIKTYQSLGGTLSNNAIPLPLEKPEQTEVLGVFSKDGKFAVNKANDTITSFQPTEKTEKTTETPEKTKPITLTNIETGAQLDYEDNPANRTTIQALINAGQWTLTSGNAEGLSLPDENKTQEQINLEQNISDTRAELVVIKNKMVNLLIPDAEVQGQIESITTQWDARINEMERTNKSRIAALTTSGLRMGSQYTGGIRGGVVGSIITAEERDGLDRIANLEAQKQQSILAAKQAQREQNYRVLVEQADTAEKLYSKQIDELNKLNEANVKEAKNRQEEEKNQREKMAADQLYAEKTIKSIGSVFLQEIGGSFGDEDSDIDKLKEYSSFYGVDEGALLNEAIRITAEREQKFPAGDRGNFLFAQEQYDKKYPDLPLEQWPSYLQDFDTWLTREANRKIDKPKEEGLTPYQTISLRNQIEDNLFNNPAVKAFGEIVNFGVPVVIERFDKKEFDSVADTILMRSLAKITDPTTGVREEEYRTFETAIGELGKIITLPKKVIGKGRLTKEGREWMIREIQDRYESRKKDYLNQYEYYKKQAERGGVDLPPPYLGNEEQNEKRSEERIEVISPSGEGGTIPKSQLEEALKQGYKQK